MSHVYLNPNLRFKIENDVYTILKRLDNGNIQVQSEQFGDIKIFTQNELKKLLSLDKLKFEVKGKNISKTSDVSLCTSFDFDDIEQLKHKEEAIFRYEVLKPLLEIPFTYRKRSDIESRANEINSWLYNPKLIQENLSCSFYKKVSSSSIYRWISYFEESNGDIRSLIPSYHRSGGKGNPRLHPTIMNYITETIKNTYLDNQRITIKEAHYDVINKISEYNEFSKSKMLYPPYSTFARYVSKVPEFELVAYRIGKRSAEQQFSPVGKGVIVNYPLERVEIDATEIDVIIVLPEGTQVARPHIVAAIDKYSREIVGFSIAFGGVGWPEVMDCIKHIITDKSYVKEKYTSINNEWPAFGIPKTVVVDNGLGFKNNSIKDASYQLGFVLEFAPPKIPEWKGSIERFFGTSNTGLIHSLPGTTRSNPKQLGDDENPSEKACIPFSVFIEIVHKWIIDIYSQDINKGAGSIPSKIWDDAISKHPVAWPSNMYEVVALLGRLKHRHISRKGIELDGLFYNSIDLNKLFIKFSLENKGKEQKFKVKYDPYDLGEIYVYDHLIEKKWNKVLAVNQDYARNLSEWEHKEAREIARRNFRNVDIISLVKAKAEIRAQINQCSGYSKKRIAKEKRINSTTEISSGITLKPSQYIAVNYGTHSHSQISITNIDSKDISNIGNTYFQNEPQLIISNPKETIEVNTSSEKVIELKKKTRKTIKSNDKQKNDEGSYIKSEELTEEDLSGFRIIMNLPGDQND